MLTTAASALLFTAALFARVFACEASPTPTGPRAASAPATVAAPAKPAPTKSGPAPAPAQTARPAAPRTGKHTLPAHLFM